MSCFCWHSGYGRVWCCPPAPERASTDGRTSREATANSRCPAPLAVPPAQTLPRPRPCRAPSPASARSWRRTLHSWPVRARSTHPCTSGAAARWGISPVASPFWTWRPMCPRLRSYKVRGCYCVQLLFNILYVAIWRSSFIFCDKIQNENICLHFITCYDYHLWICFIF